MKTLIVGALMFISGMAVADTAQPWMTCTDQFNNNLKVYFAAVNPPIWADLDLRTGKVIHLTCAILPNNDMRCAQSPTSGLSYGAILKSADRIHPQTTAVVSSQYPGQPATVLSQMVCLGN